MKAAIWTFIILAYIGAWVLSITTYSGELMQTLYIIGLVLSGAAASIHYITYGRKGVKE